MPQKRVPGKNLIRKGGSKGRLKPNKSAAKNKGGANAKGSKKKR